MAKTTHPIIHRLKVLNGLRERRAFQRIAHAFDLVYFGSVAHDDEHQLVRGVTFSAQHFDSQYCVGNVNGYDVTLLRRIDRVHFPGKESQLMQWTVLQLDLHETDVPHVFVNNQH